MSSIKVAKGYTTADYADIEYIKQELAYAEVRGWNVQQALCLLEYMRTTGGHRVHKRGACLCRGAKLHAIAHHSNDEGMHDR